MNDFDLLQDEALLRNLSESDRKFARSLLEQASKRRLSEKQRYWVAVLAERATTPAVPNKTVDVGDMSGLIALFDTARQHLNYPKIRLVLHDGTPVCLGVAGGQSKYPGSINVSDGGPYGDNRWFGRVSPAGAWEPSKAMNEAPELMTALTTLLRAMAQSPAETAAEYGRLTGNCCFCMRKLTEERSTAVGYGRTCAEHYGLPWG